MNELRNTSGFNPAFVYKIAVSAFATILSTLNVTSAFADSSTVTNAFFATRSNNYLNCYDSQGDCRAVSHFNNETRKSDELFELIDLNGGDLRNGDRIMLRTRKGYYVNSYDSRGTLKAIPTFSEDEGSDEVFRIFKVGGSSAGNEIKFGDKVMIRTRKNYAFNCYDSRGKCQAIQNASEDPKTSDEVFIIYLNPRIN